MSYDPNFKIQLRIFTSFVDSLDSLERTVRGYEGDGLQVA